MDQDTRDSRRRRVLSSVVIAAVVAGLIVLIDRVLFNNDWTWPWAVALFVALFVVNLAAPSISRFFRGPHGQ
jgi:hypothetical protein